jgi:hypothetical protein
MWVISGPFDGEEKNEIGFKSKLGLVSVFPRAQLTRAGAKLLKTGSRYSLGRKERQLTVNHSKVSHDHGAFTVGSYSQEDIVSLPFDLLWNTS